MKKKIKDLLKDRVELALITDVTGGIAVAIEGTRIMGEKVCLGRTIDSKKLKKYDVENIFKSIFGWKIGAELLEQEIEVEDND